MQPNGHRNRRTGRYTAGENEGVNQGGKEETPACKGLSVGLMEEPLLLILCESTKLSETICPDKHCCSAFQRYTPPQLQQWKDDDRNDKDRPEFIEEGLECVRSHKISKAA